MAANIGSTRLVARVRSIQIPHVVSLQDEDDDPVYAGDNRV